MTLAERHYDEDTIVRVTARKQVTPTRVLLERAFFTKESVLKLIVNTKRECYLQWGWKSTPGWEWKNVKLNDMELGEILLVLEGRKEKASFYHTFEAKDGPVMTQIWVHRSNDFCTFKVKEASKALNAGEQAVFAALARHAIVLMNLV